MDATQQSLLFPAERQKGIYQHLQKQNAAKVNELAQLFNVSEMTIRRDLEELERKDMITRTHGGAILSEGTMRDLNVEERQTKQLEEKQMIAQKAKELIKEGDILALDASTSAAELAKLLHDIPNLTVVTNSLLVANAVQHFSNVTLIMCGGIMRQEASSFVGPLAEAFLLNFHFTKTFFSSNAVHPVNGITDTNMFEISMKRLMISRSKEAYALMDSTKYNKVAFSPVCPFDQISGIITDSHLNEEIRQNYQDQDIAILIANETI